MILIVRDWSTSRHLYQINIKVARLNKLHLQINHKTVAHGLLALKVSRDLKNHFIVQYIFHETNTPSVCINLLILLSIIAPLFHSKMICCNLYLIYPLRIDYQLNKAIAYAHQT